MARDVRHVAVYAAGNHADLTLPAGVPVLELVPALADLCRAGDGASEATPPAWGLTRPGGAPFAPGWSLSELGVVDGELLCLVDTAVWRAPVVRTAAELLVDAARASVRWDARATAALLAALAGAQLVAAAGVAGWLLGLAAGRDAAGLAAAAAGLTLAVLAISPAAPVAVRGLAVPGVSLAAAVAAAVGGADLVKTAAVLSVLAVAGLRLLPRLVEWRLAGLSPERSPEAMAAAALRGQRLLASLSAGAALTAMGAIVTLLAVGDLVAGALAAVVALALLLQVPAYRHLPHALPPAAAAAASFVAVELAVALRLLLAAGHGPAAAAVLAVGAAVTGTGAVAMRRPLDTAVRWMQRGWPLLDAAIVPLALAELGVFALLSRLAHTLVH